MIWTKKVTYLKRDQEPPCEITEDVRFSEAVLHHRNFEDLVAAVGRHRNGDWGEVDDSDRYANENPEEQDSVFSIFRDRNGLQFVVASFPPDGKVTVRLFEDEPDAHYDW